MLRSLVDFKLLMWKSVRSSLFMVEWSQEHEVLDEHQEHHECQDEHHRHNFEKTFNAKKTCKTPNLEFFNA